MEGFAKKKTRVFTLNFEFFGEYFDLIPGLKSALIKAEDSIDN